MRRNISLSRGTAFPAALGNALQDEQEGLIPASDTPAIAIKGADGRWWNTPTGGIADGTLRVIDTQCDWRNRVIWGVLKNLGAADRRPGSINDHLSNDPSSTVAVRAFYDCWTGSGAVGAAASTVANGTPPVIVDNSFPVVIDEGASSTARAYLYARPTDGALCLYNALGATLHATLRVYGAAAAITGAPPPDVIPTLTLVQWLTPSLAAARPADPGGPALHRATDTGALTYFDGTTWRDITAGGGGGVANPMTEDLDADGNGVKNLPPPSDPNDAATKAYVDAAAPPVGTTNTTNATPTTFKTLTIGVSTTRLARITATAVSDDGTKHGAWSRTVAFSRASDGTLTGLDSVDVLAATSGTGWNADPTTHLVSDVGASSVAFKFVGPVATNITWKWKVEDLG